MKVAVSHLRVELRSARCSRGRCSPLCRCPSSSCNCSGASLKGVWGGQECPACLGLAVALCVNTTTLSFGAGSFNWVFYSGCSESCFC
uniref:Uncharacterized protein n=1 Tax=Physcomitrium patens TaxID=3218 RepID=A0A2K1KPK4_PHYPA|nr:hypothetical protein PHYPA_006578 [Physcomitrium patens]